MANIVTEVAANGCHQNVNIQGSEDYLSNIYLTTHLSPTFLFPTLNNYRMAGIFSREDKLPRAYDFKERC